MPATQALQKPNTQPLRVLFAVLLAAAIQVLAGCAAWHARNWDLSQLRDPRAADLDQRLAERPEPTGAAFRVADRDAADLSGAQGADNR